uniref:Fucoxanthin chlorophyll a/c binding protein II (FCPII-2) n=1 Tax=Chrysotila roscoffensis TaxID=418908 RepID=UPI003CDF86DC
MKAPPPKAKGRGWLQKARIADEIDVTGSQYVNVAGLTPQYDEIGVLPPLGRWDPLNIKGQGEARYRRFVEMEIKHGRMAMAAVLGVLTTYSGIRFPGYLSKTLDLKFEDVPGTMIGSWATVPVTGWIQIVLFVVLLEASWWKQDPAKAPGDVVPEGVWWARYPDGYSIFLGDGSVKTVAEDELFLGKTWKLNAERNNGRAAMMGITGMYVHELLTGNPVYPLGEL